MTTMKQVAFKAVACLAILSLLTLGLPMEGVSAQVDSNTIAARSQLTPRIQEQLTL